MHSPASQDPAPAGLRAKGRLRNDCEPLPMGAWVLNEIKGHTGPWGRSTGDSRMLGVWTQQDSGSCSTVSPSDFVQWIQNLKKNKKLFFFFKLYASKNVASEDKACKGWSILTGTVHKTGYIHSVPQPCLAKPRDLMFLFHS